MTEFSRQTREKAVQARQPARSTSMHAERCVGGELHSAAELGFSLGNMSIYPNVQAKQTMSMQEPASLQRQADPEMEGDEDEEIQAKPLADGVASLAQRQVEDEDEELQMKASSSCPECEEEEIQAKAIGDSITPTVQREVDLQQQEPEEDEELLQGKMIDTVQRQTEPEEEELMQGKFESGLTGTLQAKEDVPPNETGMPDHLKSGIENISGMDLSNVRVHYNSAKPAEINALAYTRGQEIHVAPGQERHLPHEAWHAVQQKQGRVRATIYIKGLWINNDPELEQEADDPGIAALYGRTIAYADENKLPYKEGQMVQQHSNKNGILQAKIKLRGLTKEEDPELHEILMGYRNELQKSKGETGPKLFRDYAVKYAHKGKLFQILHEEISVKEIDNLYKDLVIEKGGEHYKFFENQIKHQPEKIKNLLESWIQDDKERPFDDIVKLILEAQGEIFKIMKKQLKDSSPPKETIFNWAKFHISNPDNLVPAVERIGRIQWMIFKSATDMNDKRAQAQATAILSKAEEEVEGEKSHQEIRQEGQTRTESSREPDAVEYTVVSNEKAWRENIHAEVSKFCKINPESSIYSELVERDVFFRLDDAIKTGNVTKEGKRLIIKLIADQMQKYIESASQKADVEEYNRRSREEQDALLSWKEEMLSRADVQRDKLVSELIVAINPFAPTESNVKNSHFKRDILNAIPIWKSLQIINGLLYDFVVPGGEKFIAVNRSTTSYKHSKVFQVTWGQGQQRKSLMIHVNWIEEQKT